jgi:hypothetical protein
MSKLSFSHTAIKDFENCALAFKHKRVLKSVKFIQGPEAKWGEEVHKAFELRIKDGTPLPPGLTQYEPMMLRFDGLKTECEKQFCLNDSLKPTDWFSDDAWLRGIVDVLVWIDEETVFVLDWKTGKRRPDFDQLELFALLIWAHYPEVKTVKTALVWTKSAEMDKQDYHRDQCNELWTKHIGRIRRIYRAEETGLWPAKPSGLCPYCDVHKQLGCEFAKVRR